MQRHSEPAPKEIIAQQRRVTSGRRTKHKSQLTTHLEEPDGGFEEYRHGAHAERVEEVHEVLALFQLGLGHQVVVLHHLMYYIRAPADARKNNSSISGSEV